MPTTTSGRDALALTLDPTTEHVLLDLRNPLARATSHIAVSAGLPLHELEQRIGGLVPRLETPIVLAGIPSVDERGAAILESLGYRDVRLVEEGLAGWVRAGGRVYSGTNVRSKALGEWIEERLGTPTLDVATLQSWRDDGVDVVVLDSRPHTEYLHHHIPGGIDVGGGVELAYRAAGVVPDPRTPIVVNCAGRTRGIVGAQSLIATGIPNPVYSLHNGTPAWEQAGYDLAFGEGPVAGPPEEIRPELRLWIDKTLESAGVRILDATSFNDWVHAGDVTTYVIDIRSPGEFAVDPVPGSRSVPGGQLLQEADAELAVRGARVVLVDTDDLARTASTVQWLQILHEGPLAVVPRTAATTPVPVRTFDDLIPAAPAIHWREADDLLGSGDALAIDLRTSAAYLAGHVPGSIHARREHLADLLARHPEGTVVLIGGDDFRPDAIAHELAATSDRTVAVLIGGAAAAGDALTTHAPRHAAPPVDQVGPPAFGPERDRWYTAYFEWEYSLLPALAGDPHVDFERLAR